MRHPVPAIAHGPVDPSRPVVSSLGRFPGGTEWRSQVVLAHVGSWVQTASLYAIALLLLLSHLSVIG